MNHQSNLMEWYTAEYMLRGEIFPSKIMFYGYQLLGVAIVFQKWDNIFHNITTSKPSLFPSKLASVNK